MEYQFRSREASKGRSDAIEIISKRNNTWFQGYQSELFRSSAWMTNGNALGLIVIDIIVIISTLLWIFFRGIFFFFYGWQQFQHVLRKISGDEPRQNISAFLLEH